MSSVPDADYHLLTDRPSARGTAVIALLRTSVPLLLAIAGSGLTPLPCAFSLSGIAFGTLMLVAVGCANDYTTVLMVKAAARLNVSGYEEVVLAAGGRRALLWCRVALVVLLFGTMCGSLAAIQETAVRAVHELGVVTGAKSAAWLAASAAGRTLILTTITALVLLPLSLASLGDLPFVSTLGVSLMLGIAMYIVCSAAVRFAHDGTTSARMSLPAGSLGNGLPRAASTLGYAFYVQPYVLPLLRTLPAGQRGSDVLVGAVHITYAVTALAYLCVGLGGYILFGQGNVPQDLLQGFHGHAGGASAAVFSVYLMLCFSPNVVPLRETLVRLYHEQRLPYFSFELHPETPLGGERFEASPNFNRASPNIAQPPRGRQHDGQTGAQHAGQRAGNGPAPLRLKTPRGVAPPPPRAATLPPVGNALLTSALVGGALSVALLLPDASSILFALTGATGVCAISCMPSPLPPPTSLGTFTLTHITPLSLPRRLVPNLRILGAPRRAWRMRLDCARGRWACAPLCVVAHESGMAVDGARPGHPALGADAGVGRHQLGKRGQG